jgi:hypothetical protein
MKSDPDLPDDALPGLFQAADQASLHGQKRYVRASGLRLVLIVLAAAAAAVTLRIGKASVDVMAIVTAVVFVATALVEVYLLAERPERSWYDGRALAQSAKTLAWRYAVGGDPFPKVDSSGEEQVARRFHERLEELLRDAPEASVEATAAPAISRQIKKLRSSSLDGRMQAYLTGRILDQQVWYTAKAKANRSRSHWWRIALLSAELLGVAGALLRAFGAISFDLAGIIAAMIGAGAAWLAGKQHDFLARTYAFAANELALARSRLEDIQDPHAWAAEVANAEAAISREHVVWRASRAAFNDRLP